MAKRARGEKEGGGEEGGGVLGARSRSEGDGKRAKEGSRGGGENMGD